MSSNSRSLLLVALLGAQLTLSAHAELLLFAASSTTEVMQALAKSYAAGGGARVRFNFASSGTLARQIDAGAAADLFVSANTAWMDWLAVRAQVQPESRFNLAANALVMVAPRGHGLAFDGRLTGRLAVGDFKGVPAGMYAAEALHHMGWLERLRPRLVQGANARSTLMLVERGEVAAGIVYATDAKASTKVTVVGQFPSASHRPIKYPVAACSDNMAVRSFLEFLRSKQARAILIAHGFIIPSTTEGSSHDTSVPD